VSQPQVLDGLIMPAVARLAALKPRKNSKIEVYPRRCMAVRLSRGAFDIGISTMPVPTETVDVPPFSKVGICAILKRDHRLAGRADLDPRELTGEPYIALEETTAIRRLFDNRHPAAAERLKVAHEVSATFTAIQIVRAGMGFTLVDPTGMDPGQLDAVAVVPLAPRIEIDVAIFLLRTAHVHPVRAAFIRLLRETAAPGC
jgi:DNA-binding transcriptional LysR family regulator